LLFVDTDWRRLPLLLRPLLQLGLLRLLMPLLLLLLLRVAWLHPRHASLG
jgi:hypothetical protein